jgi:hypothetical protein
MAHRQSRVEVEHVALTITDNVMRELVPAIEQRVREASVAAIAPLAAQVAELAEAVAAARSQLAGTLAASVLEDRLATLGEVCERFCDRAITTAMDRVAPFAHVGTYQEDREYHRNEFVTHKGCMWHARSSVPAGMWPGTDQGAEFWTLAVKSGRDAKGA